MLTVPNCVQHILNKMEENGYQCYLVGGCVRDMIMGKKPHDFDLCTNAVPDEIIEVFDSYKVLETGRKHGTITVVYDEQFVEITTFRVDGDYGDNRHPDNVNFSNSIEEDLSRRDFTINAIAYNKSVIDPFNGVGDIKNRIVKTVGCADLRFQEDALRIMRALRFACVLQFTIDEQTRESIHLNFHLLKNISQERITAELFKIFESSSISQVLIEFKDVFEYVLFNGQSCDVQLWHRLSYAVGDVDDIICKIAVLFYCCINFDYKSMLQNLKLSSPVLKKVNKLLDNIYYTFKNDRASVKLALNKLGLEDTVRILKVKKALLKNDIAFQNDNLEMILEQIKSIVDNNECYCISQLAINGDDIIALKICSGKGVGKMLNECLNEVIHLKIQNNKEMLKKYVKEKLNY